MGKFEGTGLDHRKPGSTNRRVKRMCQHGKEMAHTLTTKGKREQDAAKKM